jgi:7-cyano-7-deazaguanine synthase
VLRITEIFLSLQGETSTVGRPTTFVRLTGCPLRCQYCDTAYAFSGGKPATLDDVLTKVRDLGARYVTVTGGEPLAQPECVALLERLCDEGYRVSLETSGALDVSAVDPRVVKIVDLKTPGSGEANRNLFSNLEHLRAQDEVKFVICDRADYEWARDRPPRRLGSRGPPTGARADPASQGVVGRRARPMKRAVVLVSGGLDSATTLAIAKSQGYSCHALSFRYGQRHAIELDAARRVADAARVDLRIVDIDLRAFGGSALTDSRIDVPETATTGIPVTYVPARNTVFLSLALAYAETLDARDIFIGVNAVDYSGYPDCRPEFIAAFEKTANLATKLGVEAAHGERIRIHTPLIAMTKADIIRSGVALGVDYTLTVSCYQPDANARACGKCYSCRIRRDGFAAAGIGDPTIYQRGGGHGGV